MISYGDQPGGIILHIIIVLHQRCLNCSECFQRHLMFYTCNYNIRVTRENGAVAYFLHESDPRRVISRCSLFILSLHALALHLAVKMCFKSFCALSLFVYMSHLSVDFFPPECQRDPHFVTQPILLSENILIFDINHQQNTKEVRPD